MMNKQGRTTIQDTLRYNRKWKRTESISHMQSNL